VKVNSEGRETETGKVIERRSEGDSFWSVPKHGCVVGFIGLGATSQGPMSSACLPVSSRSIATCKTTRNS
jgi:hypothetical protein